MILIIESGSFFKIPQLKINNFKAFARKMVNIYETSCVQLKRYFHIYESEEKIKNRFRSKGRGRSPGFDFHIFKRYATGNVCACCLIIYASKEETGKIKS